MRRALTFDDVALVPQYNNVESRGIPDLGTWLTKDLRVSTPIVNSPMDSVISLDLANILWDLGSAPIFHRFFDLKSIPKFKGLERDFNRYFITCGARYEDNYGVDIKFGIEWFKNNYGCKGILIDTAHGHSPIMEEAIKRIKDEVSYCEVIAGSVCTADGYVDLAKAGADAIRVGIGPGAACTTRVITGFGVPQFTAIQDCAEKAKKFKVPIIADGGIRGSADIVKALAAGANTVMLGKMLALTEESAAEKRGGKHDVLDKNGNKWDEVNEPREAKYRGQASADFQKEQYGRVKDGTVPEGIDFWAPVSGSASDLIDSLCAGIRSGFTYGGATTIKELQRKAEFVEVTRNYIAEANPRES